MHPRIYFPEQKTSGQLGLSLILQGGRVKQRPLLYSERKNTLAVLTQLTKNSVLCKRNCACFLWATVGVLSYGLFWESHSP